MIDSMSVAQPRPVPWPGWRLDQLSSAGRENLDAAHVARYDTIEDAGALEEVEVLQGLGLKTDHVVVDVGAGTGQFTLAVAPHCARVVAVDVSPLMLAALRDKIDVAAATNIEVVQGGFLDYEHHGPAADIIYSRFALHHVPDFWKGIAFARLRSALKPGGLLRLWDVVYNFEPFDAEARLEAWCATGGPDDDDSAWSRADYEEHVRDEHSTYTWILEALAERAGFVIEQAEHSAGGTFAKYVLRLP